VRAAVHNYARAAPTVAMGLPSVKTKPDQVYLCGGSTKMHFSVRAEPRYLIVTDAISLVAIEVLLVAVARVRMLLSPLAVVLLCLVVLAGFAADVAIWLWTGVRSVELSEGELVIYRGAGLSRLAVARTAVRRLRIRRLLGVGVVRLRTRSGQYVRISENAFPRAEFRRFLAALETWTR